MSGSVPPSPASRFACALLAVAAAGCAAGGAARGAPARPPSTIAPGATAGSTRTAPPAGAPASAPPAAARAAPATPPPAGRDAKERPGALLVGAWRPASGPRADLDRQEPGADVVLEFRADGTWTIAGTTYRSRGTYRWLDGGELELTTVDSNLASQVGTVSRRRVRVDATDLALVVEARRESGRRLDDVVTRFRRVAGR